APTLPPPQLLGPRAARDDDPVVAVEVDRLVAERLGRDQGANGDLVPELVEPGDERIGPPVRARDDDPHERKGASSAATASGSSPCRRSSQRPSSSATSAVSTAPSWYAATGARQPPPIRATQARSASTRRRVSGS